MDEQIKIQEANTHNKDLGAKGEKAAAKFLDSKGYTILDKNWTCKFGEIDIVARLDNTIVFVEVKTRKTLSKGLPEDSVNAKKRKKYEILAASYLQDHDYIDMSIRFDVVGIIVLDKEKAFIRHHINAFGVA